MMDFAVNTLSMTIGTLLGLLIGANRFSKRIQNLIRLEVGLQGTKMAIKTQKILMEKIQQEVTDQMKILISPEDK